jgi:phenylalanyl-tRNA synthetase beta chain
MRFSEVWLREWVNPDVDTQTLADQLTMAGLEVDSLEPVAGPFSGVVVGRVVSLAPHPNADKLRVCQVDPGSGETLQIVCGASNVAADMRVPVALVGAVLTGGLEIKRAKLRGVESSGMICSAAELGLEEKSAGILPLPDDAPLGQDLRTYLQLDDWAIEVDLTPDRGDCLGMAGIAREVGVINRSPVSIPAVEPVVPTVQDRFEVRLEAPEACPRYACRILRGIDPSARTPLWMRERLRRGGIRAISPVVDVTNYVMLELGQPLHGFDLNLLNGRIEVRMAAPGERLTLLDGQELSLQEDTLVIADAQGPVAMAGIMGGEHSGVVQDTRDILLESAFFWPLAISGRPRSYGLSTDSGYRFERGVDPQLQVRALERATRLLLDIVGGEPGPVIERVALEHLPERPAIRLRRDRIRRVLGLALDDALVEDILRRLEMHLESTPEGWSVTAPSCRFDMAIEVDLIEEIGRIYGYSAIPMSHAVVNTAMRPQPEARFDLDRARDLLAARGYQEVVTYSFVSPDIQALVDSSVQPVTLTNPLSAELSVMRTSLWPGLLACAQYNLARQQERVRIFESGLRFVPGPDGLRQEPVLAALVVGQVLPEQWGSAARSVDFFDVKGDLDALLDLAGQAGQVNLAVAERAALHPGQSARLERAGESLGWLGMLHPQLQRTLDLPPDLFLFELRLDAVRDGTLPVYKPLSRFPSIRRDLALVVDRDLTFRRLRDCIRNAAPEILQDISLFDVYTGTKIDSGRKSLALGLILQDSSHTLTDEEVDAAMEGILRRLKAETGAVLRD